MFEVFECLKLKIWIEIACIVLSFHLVNIANNYWWEEHFREGDSHGVHGGHHGGVHEVDGVAVEEDSGTAHGNTHNDGPEDVFESCNKNNTDQNIFGKKKYFSNL